MGISGNPEPKEVFYFFEEICRIPHGSGNIDAISNYLKEFAESRGLFCIQDKVKNIIIVKEATKGYEREEPLIIQGHMDMVAVKKPDCDIDMNKEPLRLAADGDNLYAEGTSLGGDDGIAVAYALALLDSRDIPHPRLEVVITVDEEVGMDGAFALDLSMLKGKRLINLDSEKEGIFWASCAGGARVYCSLPLLWENTSGIEYRVRIKGLLGGHSGAEIHKGRANSNCLMGKLLWELSGVCDLSLVNIKGGLADNAIARETEAVIRIPNRIPNEIPNRSHNLIPKDETGILSDTISAVEERIRTEYASKDPDIHIELQPVTEHGEGPAVRGDMLKKVAALLTAMPYGVISMCADIEGLVETSLNMGLLSMDNSLEMVYSVRSSLEGAKHNLIEQLKAIMFMAGGKAEVSGDYPGWAYRQDSPLRDKLVRVYERMYGRKPEIAAIHAGLECGIISSKIDNLDCISIGPDMKDIHTTEETLSISSTKRVWEFLLEVLKEKEA